MARWRESRWLQTAPLQGAERLAHATIPVFVLGVFAVAWVLEPDSRGLGTHEQLNLLPCVSVRLLDLPCPFCGMTTSFALFADGEPAAAFVTQPAGAIFFVLAAVAGIAALGFALAGRWWPVIGEDWLVKRGLIIGASVVALAWIYKIVTYQS